MDLLAVVIPLRVRNRPADRDCSTSSPWPASTGRSVETTSSRSIGRIEIHPVAPQVTPRCSASSSPAHRRNHRRSERTAQHRCRRERWNEAYSSPDRRWWTTNPIPREETPGVGSRRSFPYHWPFEVSLLPVEGNTRRWEGNPCRSLREWWRRRCRPRCTSRRRISAKRCVAVTRPEPGNTEV